MQIKTGTASVTNGSNRVIFATADLSAITLNALFALDRVLGAPVYPIIGIQKPAASPEPWSNSASGLWEIFLAVNYQQADNPAAAFLVQKDFLDFRIVGAGEAGADLVYYVAQFEAGDTQTLALVNRNFLIMANALSAFQSAPKYILNADQGLYFPIGVTGAAGEEVIGITGPGIP